MKKILSEARAKAMLHIMARSSNIPFQPILDIPKEWAKFQQTNDYWINIEFPESENTTACIYIGQKDAIFNPHKHRDSIEHLTILNPGGEIELVTDKYIKVIKFPESVIFKKNEPHAVKFITKTKILVMWHPKMKKGWQAEFLEESEK